MFASGFKCLCTLCGVKIPNFQQTISTRTIIIYIRIKLGHLLIPMNLPCEGIFHNKYRQNGRVMPSKPFLQSPIHQIPQYDLTITTSRNKSAPIVIIQMELQAIHSIVVAKQRKQRYWRRQLISTQFHLIDIVF